MSNINIDQLADEISRIFDEYQSEIMKGIDTSSASVANKAVKTLKKTSPVRTSQKERKYSGSGKSYKAGSYAKGWTVEKEQEFAESPHYTVHNKTHYQLTHLLENGHVTRNGGRTRKYPHIKQVEEQVIDEYEQAVEEVIRNAAR